MVEKEEGAAATETSPLLNPPRKKRKKTVRLHLDYSDTISFCMPFLIPHTRHLWLVCSLCMLCIISAKAFFLVQGLFLQITVDALSSDNPLIKARGPIIGAFVFLIGRFFVALSTQGFEVSLEYYSNVKARQFANLVFSHLQALSVSYHNVTKAGETTSLLRRGIDALDVLLRQVVFFFIPTIIETCYVSLIFFHIGTPAIAFTTFATVLLHIIYSAFLTKWRIQYAREIRQAETNVWSHATERIVHHGTVKSFGMDEEESRRQDSLREFLEHTAFRTKKRITFFDISADFILQFGTFLGYLIAGIYCSRGVLSIGYFTMAVTYISALFYPLLQLSEFYGDIVTALANMEGVMKVMNIIPEVQDVHHATDICDVATARNTDEIVGPSSSSSSSSSCPSVEFKNVSFIYNENDVENSGGVRDISFTVRSGKMVALVGPSGAGKSTIVRLLLRLYDVQSGEVLINDTDIRQMTQTSLRRAIGVVAQETILFNDTFRNNVKYGLPSATDTKVWQSLETASLSEYVKQQQLGIDSAVGEHGLLLSCGERQRVGIARAIIKDPMIMILDESTSSVSSLDEVKIQHNLRSVCAEKTTVAVAHRLSTIMMADEILVLDHGRIVQRGNHSELLQQDGGLYQQMWNAQSGGSEDD